MTVTTKFEIELISDFDSAPKPEIHANQQERYTRTVEFSLKENGIDWPIPANAACVIRYMKPDGHGGVYSTLPDKTTAYRMEGNNLTVTLVPQMLNVAGYVEAEAVLVWDEKALTAAQFTVIVSRNPDVGLVDSTDYFSFQNMDEINTAIIALQNKTVTDKTLTVSNSPADAGSVGAALEGKAPAGYGLGTQKQSNITTLEQLNSTGNSGWYELKLDGEGIHGFTQGLLGVNASSLVIEQVFMPHQKNLKLIRTWIYDHGWGEWEWQNPPMEMGEEYRTSERIGNNAVYKKRIYLGNLPNKAIKSVDTGVTTVVNVKNIEIGITDGTYWCTLPYFAPDGACQARCWLSNNGTICLQTMADMSSWASSVIIEYIKE